MNTTAGRASGRLRRGGALRIALAAGAVVLLAGGGFFLWPRSGVGSKGSAADLTTATEMSFDITTVASGELEAKNQIEIRSKLEVPATIAEVVAEGTRVKAGDLLLRLNVDQVKQQFDQAKVEIENTRAQVEAAVHAREIQEIENDQKLRQAHLKVELAELDRLQWLEGEAKSKRQANQLALSKSLLEVERLAEKLQQSYGLLEKGFLSKDEFDRDQVSYIEAQSAWITARLNNEVFESYEFRKQEKKFQSDVEEAEAALKQTVLNNQIQLTAKQADSAAKQRVFDLADEKVKKLEESIKNATITAPAEGLVVYASSMGRNFFMFGGDGPIAIGRQVMPNELVIVLPDTAEMVATVRVAETLASRIRKGQSATVKVDAAGGRTFPGVVDSIGVLAESGGWRDPNLKEYTVKIALDKAMVDGLKPSMRCESQLYLDRVEQATAVPVQSVFSDGAVRFVHVREGTKFVRRPVNLGRQSDAYAEILAGVPRGTTVLTREPAPAELLTGAWDKSELEAAGYVLGEDGVPKRKGGGGGMAGKPRPSGEAAKPAVVEASPTKPAEAEVKTDAKAVEKPTTTSSAAK